MRCRVGDICVIVGTGAGVDTLGVRGLICEIVGTALRRDHDWSVLLANKKPDYGPGTFSAMDSWLLPIRGDDLADTPEIAKELEAA